MSILDFFPAGRSPRAVQVDTLLRIEAGWDSSDVIVVNLPVASGKSNIAYTVARWQSSFKKKTNIITPSNVLVEQYTADFPRLHTMKRQDSYTCINSDDLQPMACPDVKQLCEHYCKGCPYVKNLRQMHVVPYGVYNMHTMMAYKLYKENLILDEAHNAIPFLRETVSWKLWKHQYNYPNTLFNYEAVLKWVEAHPKRDTDRKLSEIYKGLTSGQPRFLVERGMEKYRGEFKEVLKILPIDIRNAPPILWPSGKVKKVLLLSATINYKDIETLGLDKRRVLYIEADSPIPASQRPVIYDPRVAVTYSNRESSTPILAQTILEYLGKHTTKGLIHTTYPIAAELKRLLADTSHQGVERLLFHEKNNRDTVFKKFKDSPPEEGKVLIACGLYEGVDLPYDAGRWQLITKVPWPSLADPAIRWTCEQDPKWYAWETARTVLQACGRICRTPDDYGETFIIDSTFRRLYADNKELFPEWWKRGFLDEQK